MILLDTHVVIWLALEPGRLSRNASKAISDARRKGESLAVSDIRLLEIAIAYYKGRITLTSLESFLHEVERNFTILPIGARACAKSVALPKSFPNDPADRIIAATAIVEGLTLITADRGIISSKVVTTTW